MYAIDAISLILNVVPSKLKAASLSQFREVTEPDFAPRVTLAKNEKIYGMGQYQHEDLDLKWSPTAVLSRPKNA